MFLETWKYHKVKKKKKNSAINVYIITNKSTAVIVLCEGKKTLSLKNNNN